MHDNCQVAEPRLRTLSPRRILGRRPDLLTRISFLAILFTAFTLLNRLPVAAQETTTTEERYVLIYGQMLQAEKLVTNQPAAALAKYRRALGDLNTLSTANPFWNQRAVEFRQKDLAKKIAELSAAVETTPKNIVETPNAPVPGSKGVKVLEAGAEPRQQVRLHPKEGDRLSQEMTIRQLKVESKIGAIDTPLRFPPMHITMESTVKGIAPNGDISYEMVITDFLVDEDESANPLISQSLEKSAIGLKGMAGTGAISSRGIPLNLEMKAAPDINPQVRSTLQQLSESFSQYCVAWPEEAIGPGAKWQATLPVKSQGMTIDQIATYELISMDGDQFRLKVYIAQKATNQRISNPTMPSVKMNLLNLSGAVSGDITANPTRIFPTTSKLVMQNSTEMNMEMSGQKQVMSMKMSMNYGVETK